MREETAPAKTVVIGPYEAELVIRAKARSPEAWTEIYNACYRPIYRYVRARVFDEATAEDLTSAVIVAALKGIDSYQYRGRPLLAWLYRIARNVVISHQRRLLKRGGQYSSRGLDLPRLAIWRLIRRSGRGDAMASDPAAIFPADSEGDPSTMVDRIDLRHALNKLTEAQREVVLLRFFVGLGTREIAAVMGKDAAAVYSLEARALLALRKELRHEKKVSPATNFASPGDKPSER